MKSDKLSKVKEIKNYFNILTKYPFLSLLLIGIGAITIRLIFFQNELIFNSDNLLYFSYAIDVSITNELPTTIPLPNNGWPLFLSIFFNLLNSDNFLDYMNLQSIISMSVSVITIIPLYFLAKKFVGTSFALLTTILFIFEPRIIANSLIGVTDSLFILLIVISLVLVLQKKKYLICFAFIVVAFTAIVRSEGLFLIPALSLILFLRFKITKKSIFQYLIFILICSLILLSFSLQRIENSGNDYLVGRIIISSSGFSDQTQNDPNQIILKVFESLYIFSKFLGKLMIPYLIIFVPVGIILFFKNKEIKKSLLIIPGFMLTLPSLYAYTIPALDSRYLFPILPILCIIGTYSFVKYFEKTNHKEIITILLVLIILSSSILFLIYKNQGIENQQEILELSSIINKNTNIILYIQLSPVISHLDPAELFELKKFPVLSSNWNMDSNVKIVEYTNIENFFSNMKKNGITHIVIDREINNPRIINQIFDNYEKYNNLKKIFDSQENNFNYKIEIFEIK